MMLRNLKNQKCATVPIKMNKRKYFDPKQVNYLLNKGKDQKTIQQNEATLVQGGMSEGQAANTADYIAFKRGKKKAKMRHGAY
jgi:hypothetical protein